jgi:hypothetical protein
MHEPVVCAGVLFFQRYQQRIVADNIARNAVCKQQQQDSPFACGQCGLTLSTKGNLVRHVKAKHEHKKPHTCEGCRKEFASKAELRDHFTRRHEDPSLERVVQFKLSRNKSQAGYRRRQRDTAPDGVTKPKRWRSV